MGIKYSKPELFLPDGKSVFFNFAFSCGEKGLFKMVFGENGHITICFLGKYPLTEEQFRDVVVMFPPDVKIRYTKLVFVGPKKDIPALEIEFVNATDMKLFQEIGKKFGQAEEWMAKEAGVMHPYGDIPQEKLNEIYQARGGQYLHITLPPKFRKMSEEELQKVADQVVGQTDNVTELLSKKLGFGAEPYAFAVL
jgi:hypothetical protein